MIGDRRRPALPVELVARVLLIAVAVATLQLTLFVGSEWLQSGALRMSPPIILGQCTLLAVSMLLIGRLAFRFFDVETAGLACLAAAMALPLAAVFAPVTFNPLAAQTLGLLLALNGLMARDPREGGWAVGGGLGCFLALSPSGGLLALGVLAVVAARWLRNRAERWWLVHALWGLTAVATAVTIATWGFVGQPGCGGLGLAHASAAAFAAAVVSAAAMLEPHPRALTLGGFCIAIGGAAVVLAQGGADCGAGTTLGLDAPRALWDGHALLGLQALGLPVLAVFSVVHLYGRGHDWVRRWWFDYGLLLLLAVLLTVVDGRVAPAACALAAAPLGWQLREWGRSVRNARRHAQRAAALAGFAAAVLPALPLGFALTADPLRASGPVTP